MTLETEVSLRRFIDSVWFRALARSAAVLGLPLAGAAVGYFMVIGERVTTIERDRAEKIELYNGRLDDLGQSIADLAADLRSVKSDTQAVKLETAKISGMVEAMRRDSTVSMRPRSPLDQPQVAAVATPRDRSPNP